MNHTPGNWMTKPTAFGASVIHQETGHTLASISDDHYEYQADALLMAAAPRMKAALLVARARLEEVGQSGSVAVMVIDEALAKSEGNLIEKPIVKS